LAPVFLGEKTSRIVVAGMVIALIGGGIIAFRDACSAIPWVSFCQSSEGYSAANSLLGDFLAIAGAISGAAYFMIGRHLRRKISLTPYIFLVYGTAAVFLVMAMFCVAGPPMVYPARVYGWFIALAIIPQLVGHSIFNWSLKYLPAGYLSVTLLGEPIGSTILAYIFLNEKPTGLKIIGAILILTGIGLASLRVKGSTNTSYP
jgi:drug/metabolite transporter (DMT)-like permease